MKFSSVLMLIFLLPPNKANKLIHIEFKTESLQFLTYVWLIRRSWLNHKHHNQIRIKQKQRLFYELRISIIKQFVLRCLLVLIFVLLPRSKSLTHNTFPWIPKALNYFYTFPTVKQNRLEFDMQIKKRKKKPFSPVFFVLL